VVGEAQLVRRVQASAQVQVLVQPVVKVVPRAVVLRAPLAWKVSACSVHSATHPNRTTVIRWFRP
jgi:hypothetical protein